MDPSYPALDIILRAERYLIINKPHGLLSVPGRGPHKQDCAAARVRAAFPEASGPLSVHRLDMDTSGLLLLALDPRAHAALSRLFEQRLVRKAYVAVLDGIPRDPEGQIDLPLRPDLLDRPRHIVCPLWGRPARTRYRVLEWSGNPARARVLFEPLTGRSHQIRVHAATGLHAPILGDPLYGSAPASGSPDSCAPSIPLRLHLHAASLEFLDPFDHHPVLARSDAPF